MTDIEKNIGVAFRNPDLLTQACTHRSYLNENTSTGPRRSHNERLEFLGDAVLELVVTDHLFAKFPNKQEGELTSIRAALVNTGSLSSLASDLGLNDHLLLSKGEARDTGRARQVILANTFEAVIGAIYLDQGYSAAQLFIARTLFPKVEGIVANRLWQDAKSLFQEETQEREGMTPHYRVLGEVGPDHAKKFTVGVYVGETLVAKGQGFSKQEAEQDAARAGLETRGSPSSSHA